VQDKVLGVVADILPVSLVENDRAIGAFSDQVLKVFASEGRVAAEQGVGDDTHGPHINGLAVTLLAHHFGGGIAKRACHSLEGLALAIEHLGDAEISKDEIGVGVLAQVEQVLGLEIY
jgi:hypothetical protein